MKQPTQRDSGKRVTGFTLIEVIIATGIFAMSILAIIAFLGATSQATSEVIDSGVASRIADNIRGELGNEDLDDLFDWADPADPIILFATKDGERVRLGGPNGNVGNDPETGTPPGIANRDRYFRVEVRRLENSGEVATNSTEFAESAMLPLSVQIVWPHHLPTGPATAPTPNHTVVGPEQQSRSLFNSTILRKQ